MGIRYLTLLLLAAAGAFAQNATQAGSFTLNIRRC
jgi:hypothetical protein